MMTAMDKFKKDLEYVMRAAFPVLWIRTHEEDRALRVVSEVLKSLEDNAVLFIWDCRGDIYQYVGEEEVLNPTKSPVDGPENLFPTFTTGGQYTEKSALVVLDFQFYLEQAPPILRSIKNSLPRLRKDGKLVIFLCPRLPLPEEIEKDISVIDFPLPEKEELRKCLDFVVGSAKRKGASFTEEEIIQIENIKDKLSDAGLGLTLHEAEDAFSLAAIRNIRKLNDESIKIVLDQKCQVLRKEGMLEYITPKEKMDDIGGLDVLKSWLVQRKPAFGQDVKDFGLPSPKGILLVGISGCGKSLVAKAAASNWQIGIYRLDVGKVFTKLMGESESNARKVIAVAETVAPCVTGDTRIVLGDGRVRTISELYLNCRPGERVIAIDDRDNFRSCSVPIIGVIKRPPNEIVKIETGVNVIKVTKDHKLLSEEGWKTAGELSIEDWLFFPSIESFCNGPSPDVDKIIVQGMQNLGHNHFRYGRGGWTDSHLTIKLEYVTQEFGEILGYLDSDGSIPDSGGGGRIAFKNTNSDLIDRFNYLMEYLFDIKPKCYWEEPVKLNLVNRIKSKKPIGTSYVDNALLVRVLNNLREKILNFEFHSLLPAYIRAFINGDGTVDSDNRRISITQSLKNRKKQILLEEMLRRLGIYGKFTGKQLCITGFMARKLVPILKNASAPLKDKFYDIDYSYHKGCHSLAKRNKIKEVKNGIYARVVNIEKLPDEEVYDLSCDHIHNYNSNGCISHNCILWIDEIEKGMAGVRSSGELDSGVTARVTGTILTWMQEKESPVFVIATANDVTKLPPELLRKGRFDEIFFVDLPNDEERSEIIKIQLRKRNNRSLPDEDVKKIVFATKGYTGAEIEQAVIQGLFACYNENKRDLTSQDVMAAIKTFVPLADTMKEEINFLRTWGRERARAASGSGVTSFLKKDASFLGRKLSPKEDNGEKKGEENA